MGLGNQSYNAVNHPIGPPGTPLAIAGSGTTPGTIVPATGAGAGASTSFATGQAANDAGGSFTLTAAGTPAAGVIANINLTNPYPAQNPPNVVVNIVDNTASPNVPVLGGNVPNNVGGSITQFQIVVSAALTAGHSYTVTYGVEGGAGSA